MKSLLKKVEATFGSAIQIKTLGRSEQYMAEVKLDKLMEVAAWLRMEESFRLDFLENISIYEMKGAFIVSYFLRSNSQDICFILRTTLPAPLGNEKVELPSVIGVWSQAEAFEAEQAALFGINFSGEKTNARVSRNFGDFSGFPLRKSFSWGEQVEI